VNMANGKPRQAEGTGKLGRPLSQFLSILPRMVELRQQDVGSDVEEPDPTAIREDPPYAPAQSGGVVVRQLQPVMAQEPGLPFLQGNETAAQIGEPAAPARIRNVDENQLSRKQAKIELGRVWNLLRR